MKEGEDTDTLIHEVIADSFGIALPDVDIQRTHWLGLKRNVRRNTLSVNTRCQKSYSRPIIFRFENLIKRNEVFYAKKILKEKELLLQKT